MDASQTPPPGTANGFGLLAAGGSFVATLITGAACVGPLLAIVLGIGGFGWLVQYAYLRVPATVATALLLTAGFYWAYRRRPDTCSPRALRRLRWGRRLLWAAAVVAVAMNGFEYVVFPMLG